MMHAIGNITFPTNGNPSYHETGGPDVGAAVCGALVDGARDGANVGDGVIITISAGEIEGTVFASTPASVVPGAVVKYAVNDVVGSVEVTAAYKLLVRTVYACWPLVVPKLSEMNCTV